jgi:hypothetical protein
MKTTRNVFDWASLLSLSAVAALILLGIGFLALESSGVGNISPPIPLVELLVLTFTLGVIMLWIEAWIWIARGWRTRSVELNLGLIIFMLIGPVFAAYGIHFFSKRRDR